MSRNRSQSDRFLPARYYALLLELVHDKDSGIGKTLSELGLDRAALSLPDTLLSLDQVDALIEAAVRATASDELGFHLGRLIKPSSHEFLGYALMTSATLDEALRMAARYWRLITPTFTLRHEPVAGGTRINLEPAFDLKPLTLKFHVEAIATAFHAEICFLLSNRTSAYDLHLPAWLATAARRYRQLAPVRAHFDGHQGSGLRIDVPAEMLAQPLVLADRNALAIARDRCEEELSRLTRHGSLTTWLRLMLDEASDHQPRQQELAQMLHISTRTMNRRLAGEGANFRELGKQSRHARACRMLAENELPITRIALQLGYRDSANFSRAFRRAQGQSPLQYRTSFGRSN
jgi:AraC-like DNA-binding protein